MGRYKGIRNNVIKKPDSTLELYDLKTDIGETTNIADKHPDVVAQLDKCMKSAYTPSPLWSFKPRKKR